MSETQHKMDDLAVDAGMHVRATEFLLQAVKVVIECRRILRWTYVHAYYIDSGAERTLFEYRQGELESMTEKLNKLTEGDIEQLSAARMQVLNMTQALAAYMEGMENDQVHKMVKKPIAAGGEEDEKEGDKSVGKGRGKKGKGKGKNKKAVQAEEEQWTTDAQGVIVRGKVEKGKKVSPASNSNAADANAPPAAVGQQAVKKKEGEDDAEMEEEEDGSEEAGEEEEEEGAGEEMEQQAILADIQSRASLSPTSAAAAAASTHPPEANSPSRAQAILLE